MSKYRSRHTFVDTRGKEYATLPAALRAELKELIVFASWLARRSRRR